LRGEVEESLHIFLYGFLVLFEKGFGGWAGGVRRVFAFYNAGWRNRRRRLLGCQRSWPKTNGAKSSDHR